MNLPNIVAPVSRSSNFMPQGLNEQIMPSAICAKGTCNAKECCLKKGFLKRCVPNTFDYIGSIKCCGSLSGSGYCDLGDGRRVSGSL